MGKKAGKKRGDAPAGEGAEPLGRKDYEKALRKLQVELCHL